ncbi:MAG TPA: M1 family metallopeptidase [Thermoplasmataceae archaeon]|nr:M1 family metallopeptidase [Thermoplasmataceae archaeon]
MKVLINSYKINLKIDSSRKSFSGVVEISLESRDSYIDLNAVDLEIGSVIVDGKDSPYERLPEIQAIRVPLKEGANRVSVAYTGSIPKLLTGFYLARTESQDIFTTQFESTGARRMFPCVDHPAYKARFTLSVEVDRDLDVISNMPVSRLEDLPGGKKLVNFQETPRMSTYLLYLGVGKFDERSVKRGKTDLILAAPKGSLTESDFPLEIAGKVLDFFESYFDIPYFLPKLHLISVPEFAAGAMENWGAITFREIYLSIGPSTSSSSYKSIAEVIAHEIAHQWFGDLVTMEWWNDLWLNESFATFMAFKAVDFIHKPWKFMGRFLKTETSSALNGDALKASHPIDVEVRNPDEIAQIFDEISYGKGASILRMIEGYVGHDNFRNGIRSYLKKYQYSNAKGSDLWRSIEEASGMPVSRIMEAWVKRKGYPVITATASGEKLNLKQDYFLLHGIERAPPWPVPLTARFKSGSKSLVFDSYEMPIPAEGLVVINENAAGFYRVNYSPDLFRAVSDNGKVLSPYERWQLANDIYALLLAGGLSFNDYKKRLESIWVHSDYILIREISAQLEDLYLVAPNSTQVASMIRNYYAIHKGSLGEKEDGEPLDRSIARSSLQSLFANVDKEFSASLAKKFDYYFTLDSDIRSIVAHAFAREGGSFMALSEKLSASRTDEDRTKILSAMAWVNSPSDLQEALSMVREGKVKRQDVVRFYTSLGVSVKNRSVFLENMEEIIRSLSEIFVGSRTPARVIETTVPIAGIGRADELRARLKKMETDLLAPGIRKAIELLEVNEKLKHRIK